MYGKGKYFEDNHGFRSSNQTNNTKPFCCVRKYILISILRQSENDRSKVSVVIKNGFDQWSFGEFTPSACGGELHSNWPSPDKRFEGLGHHVDIGKVRVKIVGMSKDRKSPSTKRMAETIWCMICGKRKSQI